MNNSRFVMQCISLLVGIVIFTNCSKENEVVKIPEIMLMGDLSFGSITIGQTSVKKLTVTNKGETDLVISGLTLPIGFQGSLSGSIKPGDFKEIDIIFSPQTPGSFSGTIEIKTESNFNGTNSISVSGVGVDLQPPKVQLSGNLNFDLINVGQTFKKVVYILNSGEKDLIVTKLIVPSEFKSQYAGTIKPNDSVSVDVTFTPVNAGSFTGTFQIESNSPAGTNSISISGSATQLSPSDNWSTTMSNPAIVPNSTAFPLYDYYPDGHIPVIDDGGSYLMFWPEYLSFRSESNSPFPEDHKALSPAMAVIGGRYEALYPTGTWDTTKLNNGGTWLFSVFRKTGSSLIGFAHLEYHWYQYSPAYKTIAVTSSNDNGKTWTTPEVVLRKKGKIPSTAEWSGIGDFCTIWDSKNTRWVCFYANNWIHAAISLDPDAAPGTWKKLYNDNFNEPGLFGNESSLSQLSNVPGGNPSVHFNVYLNKWIMVFHSWTGSIYISSSHDLVNWENPKLLIASTYASGLAWYPTIIGLSDVLAGQTAKIYYSDRPSSVGERTFLVRTITFNRND